MLGDKGAYVRQHASTATRDRAERLVPATGRCIMSFGDVRSSGVRSVLGVLGVLDGVDGSGGGVEGADGGVGAVRTPLYRAVREHGSARMETRMTE